MQFALSDLPGKGAGLMPSVELGSDVVFLLFYFSNLSNYSNPFLLSICTFVTVFYLFCMCGRGHTCGGLIVT